MYSFDVGQRFIRYYHNNGFKVLPRGSLLDPAVPMTFVGSAGLAQIESAIERGEDHAGERYVLLQSCFRHFDMEKVGQSPVHLSLFEMAGAFSFGPEDKEETLRRIWRFLTSELGLALGQLWATYFTGGELDRHAFAEDLETRQAWYRIGLPASRLVGLGTDGGFWKQGDGLSGQERFRKCGPTTELFFDRGSSWSCGPECCPGCQCGRFSEIANVLFISAQIDQVTGSLKPLVTPFAETVIGVERVAMSLQGKSSVFELECLFPLVQLVRSYHQASASVGSTPWLRSEQVIADHVRALLFLIADGAPPPGKGGRARIIRMLIRGILTHQKILGITQTGFISNLMDAAIGLYQNQSPHLKQWRGHLLTYFATESNCFERTLSAGYRQLDRLIQQGESNPLSGEQALDLVKGHGFPLPLLEAALVQRGMKLDLQEYCRVHTQWRQAIDSGALLYLHADIPAMRPGYPVPGR